MSSAPGTVLPHLTRHLLPKRRNHQASARQNCSPSDENTPNEQTKSSSTATTSFWISSFPISHMPSQQNVHATHTRGERRNPHGNERKHTEVPSPTRSSYSQLQWLHNSTFVKPTLHLSVAKTNVIPPRQPITLPYLTLLYISYPTLTSSTLASVPENRTPT